MGNFIPEMFQPKSEKRAAREGSPWNVFIVFTYKPYYVPWFLPSGGQKKDQKKMTNLKNILKSPLELAMEYAAYGIPVFPCDNRTKIPLVPADKDATGKKIAKSGGLYKATTCEQNIAEWWSKYPDAMIGVPTGSASGFVVLDVDIDLAKDVNGYFALEELCKKHGPLPTTGKVQTPRGGTHYYFRMPTGVKINNSAGMIAPGIDIRGEGGYIIAPGSVRNDGMVYEYVHPIQDSVEIPNWIISLICKGRTSDFKDHMKTVSRILNVASSNIYLDNEVAKVTQTLTGGRNNALNRCAFILGKAGYDIEMVTDQLLTACSSNGLLAEDGEHAIIDTINRAFGAGQLEAVGADAENLEEANECLEKFNKDYFVTPLGSQIFVCSIEKDETGKIAPVYRSFQSFDQMYSNIRVWDGKRFIKAGKFWLEHPKRRQYAGVNFVPNGPEILPGNIKNLWLGFAINPAEGDCSLILKHIYEVLADGDEKSAVYILNYLAWTVQNPDKQAEVALIFQGSEGTGKGLIGRLMIDLFGSAAIHISSSRHLVGNFNAHLDGIVLLFADEAFWAGDKAARGTLFSLITEPNLTLERKGVDAKSVVNRLHIVMASNEDWVVPASYDSRRFAVFTVSKKYKQNSDYFTPLFEQINNGGREAFLNVLLNRDISSFHPRHIIKTEAFNEQVIKSFGPLEIFWLHFIEEGYLQVHHGEAPKNILFTYDFGEHEGLLMRLRRSDYRLKNYTDRDMAKFLREKGCIPWRDSHRRGWKMPPLVQARADWEKKYGKWDWPNELEEWDTYAPHHL